MMKYVTWVPIQAEIRVEIETDGELDERALRRAIRKYVDRYKNPTLGISETLRKVIPTSEIRHIEVEDVKEPLSQPARNY